MHYPQKVTYCKTQKNKKLKNEKKKRKKKAKKGFFLMEI
jgi:hypothetical protein